MNPDDDWAPNALMDPWCLVELADGSEVLFGFAIEHRGTGGLSWVLSTSVVRLDAAAGQARTHSGRRYTLGRRLTAMELPTEEARIAFALLLTPHPDARAAVPPTTGDPATSAAWVAACKMARHLNVAPPPLHDPAAVRNFFGSNMERYALARAGRRPS
jgi:hypothetical protein